MTVEEREKENRVSHNMRQQIQTATYDVEADGRDGIVATTSTTATATVIRSIKFLYINRQRSTG